MPDLRVKGKHQPIISEALFEKVQDVLEGKKPMAAPKRLINPAFPLRGLLRCAACGNALTASFCRSKTGKRYGYYYSRTRGCRLVKSIQAKALDDQFMSMLKRLQPRPEIAGVFPSIAAHIWVAQLDDSEKNLRNLSELLEEQKQLKFALLRAKLRGEICQSDYEQGNAEFSREISETEKRIRALDVALRTETRLCGFASSRSLTFPRFGAQPTTISGG